MYVLSDHRGWKTALDLLGLELQTSYELPQECWGLKPGPLEEEPLFLSDEGYGHVCVTVGRAPHPMV